jgi:hypothetical protein
MDRSFGHISGLPPMYLILVIVDMCVCTRIRNLFYPKDFQYDSFLFFKLYNSILISLPMYKWVHRSG